LLMREDREQAGKILTHAKPRVDDDVVYAHISAEGEIQERLQRKEFVRSYYPIKIAGKERTAIAWTTAASVCGVIEMVRAGTLPTQGFIKQEKISLTAFLKTATGSLFETAAKENR
jgi:saccharopine dehydrogenase-like NADP-dependent oxidoreductase